MQFTQSQITSILEEILQQEDGLNSILKLTLEALMRAERSEHNKSSQDYSNGYRSRKTFGNKRMIELRVPRTRSGSFYPVILGLPRNQEFVSDGLKEIETAKGKHFPQCEIQFCVVHLQRYFLKQVRPKDKASVAEDFREVFCTDNPHDSKTHIRTRFERFILKWGKLYPSFKSKLNSERTELYFTYIGYDYRIRSMIYTTNWIERLHRDYKRTTRMRGALPSVEATLLLLAGVAMSKTKYSRKVPKLDYEQTKFQWEA